MTTSKGKSRHSKKSQNKLQKQIKKEILKMSEPKYVQTDLGTSISNSATIQKMAPINLGNYATDRIGNKVTPTSWSVRGNITGNDNFNYIRLVVFQWYDDNLLNPPLYTEVFENTSGNSQLYSTFNRQNLNVQFQVLADKLYRVTANSNNPDLNKARIIKLKGYKNLREMSFLGANTDGFGQIYCLLVSDSSMIGHPAFEGFGVVNYRDV